MGGVVIPKQTLCTELSQTLAKFGHNRRWMSSEIKINELIASGLEIANWPRSFSSWRTQ
jgi:hypothetical protein